MADRMKSPDNPWYQMADQETSKLARMYQIGQVGTEMAIPVGIGFALDYFLGTMPWLTVIGAILGPILGFVHLLAILKTLPEDEKEK